MQDPNFYMAMAGAALAAIAIVTFALLRGWNDWLAFKHAQIAREEPAAPPPSTAARIEMADLKERIRKLEAIAAGVDL